jgi:hypothetical protein
MFLLRTSTGALGDALLRAQGTCSLIGELGTLTAGRGGNPRADAARQRALRRAAGAQDATIVSLQYGLATRNQEMWGLRWSSVDGDFAWVAGVISYGRLEHWARPR